MPKKKITPAQKDKIFVLTKTRPDMTNKEVAAAVGCNKECITRYRARSTKKYFFKTL